MLYCYCVALLLFVLSYVLIVCTVPLPPGVNPIAVDKYIYIYIYIYIYLSCAVVMKCGNLNFLEPSGPLQACKGSALLFSFLIFCTKRLIRR